MGSLRARIGGRFGFAIVVALLMSAVTAVASRMSEADGPQSPASVVPRAECQPGDKPDTQLQGQIPIADRVSGRAEEGYFCNLRVVGTHEGRAFASFDSYKHCLYMPDETWATGAGQSGHAGLGIGKGIRVLDMSDSEHPRQTALLTSPMAKAPDESMTVNDRRGLLVMNSTGDSQIDVYSLKDDCEQPRLIGTFDMAPAAGHAGWFSPDGNIYWMTNNVVPRPDNTQIFPIDLTDPAKPKLMARWKTASTTFGHNGWTSDDGKTAYACQAGALNAEDNRILAFKAPTPGQPAGTAEQHLISSFRLEGAICQDAKAVSYDGRPFLIANSEYTIGRTLQKGPSPCGLHPGNLTNFGVPEIFDITDVGKPKVVRHLMLEIDDPANCRQTMFDGDPTTDSQYPGEVYDTHFCRPDRLHDPTILACDRFYSGLEVYDIRDPYNPKELAYYRPGTLGEQATQHPEWGANPRSLEDCTAPPVVRAARGEIWLGCYFGGLRVVKFPKSVYPFRESLTCENDYYFNQYNPGLCPQAPPSPRNCVRPRAVTIKVRGLPRKSRVRSLTVYINGKRTSVRRGNRRRVQINLAPLAGKRAAVKIVARLRGGRKVVDRRTYRVCD